MMSELFVEDGAWKEIDAYDAFYDANLDIVNIKFNTGKTQYSLIFEDVVFDLNLEYFLTNIEILIPFRNWKKTELEMPSTMAKLNPRFINVEAHLNLDDVCVDLVYDKDRNNAKVVFGTESGCNYYEVCKKVYFELDENRCLTGIYFKIDSESLQSKAAIK